MREYKVAAVTQSWSNSRLERKATEKLNSHAEEGWQLAHIRWGLNFFATPTLYMVLEREKATWPFPQPHPSRWPSCGEGPRPFATRA